MPTDETLEALFSEPPTIHGVQLARDPHQKHRLIADVHGCKCDVSVFDEGVQWSVAGFGLRKADYGVILIPDAVKAMEQAIVDIARAVRELLRLADG
jgi:hypothetical protein